MANKQIRAFQVIAHGLVQGVFYRASTQKEALRLGLVGTVQNLPDGTVRIRVQGEEELINMLMQWAQRGPPAARVDELQTTEIDVEPGLTGFEIIR